LRPVTPPPDSRALDAFDAEHVNQSSWRAPKDAEEVSFHEV
jgi:hypothetical protein